MSQYLGDISAYALAVSQGYTGTEEEYAELMASYATVGQTAVTAAQTATTKASEAATSATTATNKASEATTAAQTATTKAAEASTSASTATSAKDTAVSAAIAATTKATEATTAAATATSAATTATTAKNDAVSAKTAAQSAQTGAETAAASVQSSATQIATNTEDIEQLKSDLNVLTEEDIIKAFKIPYSITFAGRWSTSGTGYLLAVKSGDVLELANANRNSYYAVLKSKGDYVSGGDVDFATGYTSILSFNTKITVTIPSDGAYVWLYRTASGTDYTPTTLTLNGYDLLARIYDNFKTLHDESAKIAPIEEQVYEDSIWDSYGTRFTIRDGAWAIASTISAALIPVKANDKIYLHRNTTGYYAILASIDNMAHHANCDFATGFTNYVSYQGGVSLTVPTDGKYIWIYTNLSGTDYSPDVFTINGLDVYKTLRGNVADTIGKVAELDTRMDVAEGALNQLAPFDGTDLAFKQISIAKKSGTHRDIVAINHDDLSKSDYVNTRKIYNKYGFNANFNFILAPFANASNMEQKVSEVKKLIKDGNGIGLHAIFGESFWWMNKMFDVRPNYDISFAPKLDDITTDVGNGKNVFGQTIDTTKTLSYYGFVNPPTVFANIPISDLTAANWLSIIGHYTFYYNTTLITGLDLDGNVQSWKMIKWLEYWYNELIDSSLGYSAGAGNVSQFTADYDYPSGGSLSQYYPMPLRLTNGKMVFFDDTENPHYNDSAYQKVGRIKQGLYKGAASVCNFEVRERCIQIAKAFCKHYFGTDNLTMYGRHGAAYVDLFWKTDGVPYDDRQHWVLAGEHGKPYNTIKQQLESGFDVLLAQGIKNTSHNTPISPVYMGQYSLYCGQSGIRSPYFGVADYISYLTLMGASATFDGSTVSNEAVAKILSDKPDPLKFIYENVGNQVTSSDGTVTLYIHHYVKLAIDRIRAWKGSGKIPFFSLDTIVNDASNLWATELLCQYCYRNDIEIMPVEKARLVATRTDKERKQNYIPNPQFVQSLLKLFGGESTAKDAYIPDGWLKINDNGNTAWEVTTVDGKRALLMTGQGTGYSYIISRMYGLQPGTYTLTFKAKATGSHARVYVHKFLNSSLNSSSAIISTNNLTSEITEYTATFTIDEPYTATPANTPASQYNDGYENNVCEIRVQVGFSFGDTAVSAETITIYDMNLQLS